ncbi:MAG: PAS domain-containing protein, partial [Thermoplasmatota archaeon]
LAKPLETMKKIVQNTSEQLDSMNKSLKELSRKYDTVTRRLAELEKKDRRLEKKHKNLGKHMQLLEDGYRRHTKKQKNLNNTTFAEKPHKTAEFTFFSDPFGFKRQHRELTLQKQQIDIRTNQLDAFEAQLMKERKTFNARVEEFSRWREKLELLESAIEKRRQELMKQEDVLLERAPVTTQVPISTEPEIVKSTVPVTSNYHELLDKIPQSAAIVQRGILKQINSPFLELLGYTMDDIVEKSFFDFIALEGLADVEKYYLDRLKGDSVSVYKTVFSTKDDNKIPVEVNIKQTIYNGEKAEIVIITCLGKQDSRQADEPDLNK